MTLTTSIPARSARDVGRRRLFGYGGLALTGLSGSLLAACGPDTQPSASGTTGSTGQPRKGGHLTNAMNGVVKLWDPAISLVIDEQITTKAIYNTLTALDEKLQPKPELAESWTHSPDLKTWTFTLRKGVTFHHGKPFTADDAVFSIMRILDPETKSASRVLLSYIDRMEKRDDHTVVLHLKSPVVNVPADLAGYHMRILPSDRAPEQYVAEPSGTGPFKRASWSPGERVTYARNDKYWQSGLPYLDGFTMLSMPEENSRVAALSAGAVDLLWQLTAQALPAVQGQPGVSVLKAPSGNYQPIVMKSDVKPFDDVRVRQAFKAVVDRQTFVQAVTQGFGQPAADHPIPVLALSQILKEVPIPKRDVERAKRLLADAGYPGGIDVTLYTSEGRAGMVESAVTFQEMARPAGIRVTIQKTPIFTYWDEVWMKRELCMSNWTTVPTIDKALTQAYHSGAKWNESFFSSPELDRLIEQGRAEADEAKRAGIYVKAAQLLSEQGGSIISYFRDNITAARSRVKGFVMDPRTEYDFRSVWVEG